MTPKNHSDISNTELILVAPVAPPIGGITRWTQLVEEGLQICNVNYDIVNTSPRRRKIDGQSRSEQIIGGFTNIVKSGQLISFLLWKGKPRAVHIASSGNIAHFRDLILLSVAKLFRKKSVLHLHHGRLPNLVKKLSLERLLLDFSIAVTDELIVLDSPSHLAACTRWKNLKVHTISNPVRSYEGDSASAADDKTFIYIGWIKPEKGIEVLLASWEEVSPGFPEWKLNLVGGISEEYHQLLNKKFGGENWNLLGELTHHETMEILNKANFLVLPSYSEGFPNVLLEAMALKKPVIATKVGGIPDMLREGGGILTAPGMIDELSLAIKTFMRNETLRDNEGLRGYSSVVKNYSLSSILKKYCEVWGVTPGVPQVDTKNI